MSQVENAWAEDDEDQIKISLNQVNAAMATKSSLVLKTMRSLQGRVEMLMHNQAIGDEPSTS